MWVYARTAPSLPARGSCWVGGLGACPGWYQGGYTGWVYRVGIQGCYTGYPAAKLSRRTATAGSGPRAGPWVVRKQAERTHGDGGGDGYPHPSGPVGLAQASPPWDTLRNAASWPIGRDSTLIPLKLVKTRECHPNMSKRPTIVPVLKNGSKSHLLKFSDFQYRQPSLTRN